MEEYKLQVINLIENNNNIELIKFIYGILKGAENKEERD